MVSRRRIRLGLIGLAVVLSVALPLNLFPPKVVVSGEGNLSLQTNVVLAAGAEYDITGELPNGLWYSPYVKIYSLGGTWRCAEVSSYPRAYKDTTSHIYTVDTPFTVTQDDLNCNYSIQAAQEGRMELRADVADGEFIYLDTQSKVFKIGETATHYIGDSLPGAFPLWIASEDLPFTPISKTELEFLVDAIPRPISNISEVRLYKDGVWQLLDIDTVMKYADRIYDGKLTLPKSIKENDRQIIRILYEKQYEIMVAYSPPVFYLESVALSTKVWRMSQTAPASANEVTSIKNGKGAVNTYWSFVPGVTDSAVYSTSFIEGDANGAHGWRSQKGYSGTFASGNWTITYKLKNRVAYAHAGIIYARVYHVYLGDPAVANLVKMNSVDAYSGIVSFSATAGEVKTGTITVNCDQNLTLDGEVIFIVLNWKVTTAGGNVNAGVKFVVNEGSAEQIETTEFTHNVGMTQPIVGGYNDAISATTDEYNCLMGGYTWTATENTRYQCMPTAGTVGNLFVELSATPTGGSYTISVVVNGTASGVAVTIAAGSTTGSDTDVVDVVAGDTVSIKRTETAGTGTPLAFWTTQFIGTTAGESICLSNSYTYKSGTDYTSIQGGGYSTTETQIQAPIPTPGTFKKLYVKLSEDPGTNPDAYTIALRVGAATKNNTVTIVADNTTGNITNVTDAVVAGNLVDFIIIPVSTPSAQPLAAIGIVFVATTDGESLIMGGAITQPATGATNYMNLCVAREEDSWWNATEASMYSLIQTCTVKNLYVHLDAAPGAGDPVKSRTISINKDGGGAASGLTVTISTAATDGNDVVNTYNPADGDTADIKSVPGNTPAATRVHIGLVAYISACSPNISNTPSNKDFGTVLANTGYWAKGSEPTWPLDDAECTFTVTNSSGGNVDITIVATNFTGGVVGWTLDSSAGADKVVLKAGVSGACANEAAMPTLTTSPQAFISALGNGLTKLWEIHMETPTTYSNGDLKQSTITLAAVCS